MSELNNNIIDFKHYPLLYVDDEQSNLDLFMLHFEDYFNITTALSAEEGLKILEKKDIGLIITDERMPGLNGIDFLSKVVLKWPETVRIIISAYSDAELLLKAINSGRAHEYIVKPWNKSKLKDIIINSLGMVYNRKQLIAKAGLSEVYQEELKKIQDPNIIVGMNSGLKQVITSVKKIAETDIPVLIQGETGTGKEIISKLIHESSNKSNKAFIKVNCAAISEGVLQSELFGHEKGAFTGAYKSKIGKFELADNGTILLDEIGDISPTLQLSLLRVLQEQEFERVGGNRTIKVNVRIIAVTNRNLEKLVSKGNFRKDLFYRLNVFPIVLPPLRNRQNDIKEFLDSFIKKHKSLCTSTKVTYSKSVIKKLADYHWPGNIREFENMVQRALVLADEGCISIEHFFFETIISQKGNIINEIKDAEFEKYKNALLESKGNFTKAAKILGIPRTTFTFRARKLDVI